MISQQLQYMLPEGISEEEITCSICYNIPNRAKELPCCHKCICSLCGRGWLKSNNSCPFCRSEIKRQWVQNGLPDFKKQQVIINELVVQCPFAEAGCPWSDKRSLLKHHLKSKCQYIKDKNVISEHGAMHLNDFAISKKWSSTSGLCILEIDSHQSSSESSNPVNTTNSNRKCIPKSMRCFDFIIVLFAVGLIVWIIVRHP